MLWTFMKTHIAYRKSDDWNTPQLALYWDGHTIRNKGDTKDQAVVW